MYHMLRIKNYKVESSRIPSSFQGFRILHLSDLHGKELGSGNASLIKNIKMIAPDIIVMTGDMVNGKERDFCAFLKVAQAAVAQCPVYYVLGNHEQTQTGAKVKRILTALTEMGISCLVNSWVPLCKGEEQIRLYGMHFHLRYYYDRRHEYEKDAHFTAEDMRGLVGEPDRRCFNILLTHNPLFFRAYKKWGADLTLSGHIHGGIIRIPGVGGLLSPEIKLFPKYDGGMFQENNCFLEVSRGLGNNFLWRINNPPELPVLELQSIIDKL